MKRFINATLFLVLLVTISVSRSDDLSDESEGSGTAIWAGTRWFTGFDKKENRAVQVEEADRFVDSLEEHEIETVYCHVGAVSIDGSLDVELTNFFVSLKEKTPDVNYLPWIAGNAERLDFSDSEFRENVIESIAKLRMVGFNGVHLNFEPVQNGDEGYLELLREIRERFDDNFLISQATRRMVPHDSIQPLVHEHFWTQEYYRKCMELTDESVLMGYDTLIPSRRVYRSYISFQTKTLLDIAGDVQDHRVVIGVPAYENGARSFKRAENIPNALKAIKRAVALSPDSDSFGGVSLYSYWQIDEREWEEYRTHRM